MHCVVTAGPTYETMDEVRRLTNFSTGCLGTELANSLTARGHQVTLLIGQAATHTGERKAQRVEPFTTTASLLGKIRTLAAQGVGAVFHAAAVSDFSFGKIWQRSSADELIEIQAGKISTRQGTLLAELVPTPKIIRELRPLFPQATLVGWKYEVDGDRATVLAAAAQQLTDCRTNACVANGPAYGLGFGVVTPDGNRQHIRDPQALFTVLAGLLA